MIRVWRGPSRNWSLDRSIDSKFVGRLHRDPYRVASSAGTCNKDGKFPTKLRIQNYDTLQNKVAPILPKITVNSSSRVHGPTMCRTKFQAIRVYHFPGIRRLQDAVPSVRVVPNRNQDPWEEARNPQIIRGAIPLGCTPRLHERKAGSLCSESEHDSDDGNVGRRP